MACDLQALTFDRFGIDIGLTDDADLTPELPRILSRWTHRQYRADPVPEALTDLLLAVALSASSKSDFQQVAIVRLKDAEKRRRIAERFPAMPWIGTAPVLLVFCGDTRRLERIGALRGHPKGHCGLEDFLNAAVDAALAMQTFILAAESVGLGCCPLSVIRDEMVLIARELALPDGVFPIAGLCAGYPANKGHVSMRLAPSTIVHTDTYDDSALETELTAYDRRRNDRHAIPREKQRKPDLFGYADFYGWSEDKARHAAEREGTPFADYVKRHGFSFE